MIPVPLPLAAPVTAAVAPALRCVDSNAAGTCSKRQPSSLAQRCHRAVLTTARLLLVYTLAMQAEERAKKKRRGNPDTHTTDERFDESFQLAHGLTGPKPWYARAIDPVAPDRAGQPSRQQQQQQGHHRQLPPQQAALQAPTAAGSQLPELRHSRQHKKRRRHSSDSSDSSSSSSSSNDSSSSDSDSSRGRKSRRRRRSSGKSDRRQLDKVCCGAKCTEQSCLIPSMTLRSCTHPGSNWGPSVC